VSALAYWLLAAAAAAAQPGPDVEGVEEAIRSALSREATVLRVELRQRDPDHMTGFALARAADGVTTRLNCTATREPSRGEHYFDWRCTPTIGAGEIAAMEALIRQRLSPQVRVLDVHLSRVDDDRMAGFARVRDRAGNRIRVQCMVVRTAPLSASFNWRCDPPGPGR
jgi:hypothetical protein